MAADSQDLQRFVLRPCSGGLGQACATLAPLALEQSGLKWDVAGIN